MLRANRLTLSVRFTESLIGWRVRSRFGSFPEGIEISQKVGKILGLKAFGESVWHDRDIASSSLFDVVKLDPNGNLPVDALKFRKKVRYQRQAQGPMVTDFELVG